jgi:Rrf2 family protein
MVDLAQAFGEGPVLVRAIAERQEISPKYLHALLASLKSAKLVRSVRGSGGGYALARDPAEIRLNEIIEALEGPFSVVDCVLDKGLCDRAENCAARDIWTDLSQTVEAKLTAITLEELSHRQVSKESRT